MRIQIFIKSSTLDLSYLTSWKYIVFLLYKKILSFANLNLWQIYKKPCISKICITLTFLHLPSVLTRGCRCAC